VPSDRPPALLWQVPDASARRSGRPIGAPHRGARVSHVAVLPHGCGGGAGRCRARRAERPRARRARRQQMPRGGGGVCAFPPLVAGLRTPQVGRQRRSTDRSAVAHVCSGRRYVYHQKPPRLDQQVRPPPLPWLAPRSFHTPAHRSAVLPTCSGDADLGQRGQQGCGPRRWRVRRAVRPRVRRARRQQMPKGGRRAGGSAFFFFFARTVSHTPCSRLMCRQRPWRRRRQRQRAQHHLDARSRCSRERCK